jgi:hypothetical protein
MLDEKLKDSYLSIADSALTDTEPDAIEFPAKVGDALLPVGPE